MFSRRGVAIVLCFLAGGDIPGAVNAERVLVDQLGPGQGQEFAVGRESKRVAKDSEGNAHVLILGYVDLANLLSARGCPNANGEIPGHCRDQASVRGEG